jgi:hypothetical protein
MLSLRDNRLKFLPATKEIGWNFFMKRTKIKRAMYNLQKLFNAQITPKNPGNSDRTCFYVFVDYLAN